MRAGFARIPLSGARTTEPHSHSTNNRSRYFKINIQIPKYPIIPSAPHQVSKRRLISPADGIPPEGQHMAVATKENEQAEGFQQNNQQATLQFPRHFLSCNCYPSIIQYSRINLPGQRTTNPVKTMGAATAIDIEPRGVEAADTDAETRRRYIFAPAVLALM